jgi:hypothetical protein
MAATEINEIKPTYGLKLPDIGSVTKDELLFTEPLTNVQLGITFANSSAYSQLPEVFISHLIGLNPFVFPKTIKRIRNMTPLNDTGFNAYHADLNCRLVVDVNGVTPGFRFEKRPQLLRKPVEITELMDVTEVMHLSLVES